MRRIFLYTLVCLALFESCKPSKSSAEGKSGKGSSDVDPGDMRPQVDTRFQEQFFAAQLEKSKGNPDKAYSFFEGCLAIDPKNGAAHYEMGRIDLEVRNHTEEALQHAKSALLSDKLNPWYHLLLGDVQMATSNFELAVKSYREVAKLNPDDPNILYEIANAQLYAGKVQDAIQTYDELERKSGPYEELSMQKHQLWLQLNQFEKAGLELEKLAIAFPDQPRFWGITAQFYGKYNMPEKAKTALDQMVAADPNNGQVHFQLSEYYAAQGDDKKSYSELRAAFKTTDVGIDQKIGVLLKYFNLTDFNPSYLEQAYELLDLTEKLHDKEAKTYSIYGDFLYRDGRDEEALAKYQKALSLDPSRSLIWEQVLAIENETGNFTALLNDSKRALELFPNQPLFYYYQGLGFYKQQSFPDAIASLNLGKELVFDNPGLLAQFYATLGEIHHYAKNHVESDNAYEKALKIQPENVFVLNNYAYYLALRKAKLEQAEEMSNKANLLSPGQGSFEDTFAMVLFARAKYNDALVWILKAIEHSDESGELLEHYGDILFKLNRAPEALEQWKNAQALGGASDKIEQKIATKQYID